MLTINCHKCDYTFAVFIKIKWSFNHKINNVNYDVKIYHVFKTICKLSEFRDGRHVQVLKPQQVKFCSQPLPVTAGLAQVHTLCNPPFQSNRLGKKKKSSSKMYSSTRLEWDTSYFNWAFHKMFAWKQRNWRLPSSSTPQKGGNYSNLHWK